MRIFLLSGPDFYSLPAAPYIPFGTKTDDMSPKCVDERIFFGMDEQDFLDLRSPSTCHTGDPFDGFSYVWKSAQNPHGAGSTTVDKPAKESQSPSGARKNAPNDGISKSARRAEKVRSILKSPSQFFPGDSNPVASFPEPPPCPTEERMRKLRKRRSSFVPGTGSNGKRTSIISHRKSISSIFEKSTSTKRLSIINGPDIPEVPNLPHGIIQQGRGIGYTHASPVTHSRLSLASLKSTTSCFAKLVSALGGGALVTPADKVPKSRNEIMQQIYGSTWSVNSAARMSSVTFGIPEGLGRRVDEGTSLTG